MVWQGIVKFPHQEVIRVFVRSVVCFIEHKEADIGPKVDVAMAERVEEDVMRADDDTVRVQHLAPKFTIPPLVRFIRARNESDGDGEVGRDGCLLLPRERDCWREEPGDLGGWVNQRWVDSPRHWHAGNIVYSNGAHTLRDSRSISCFIRRMAM